MRVEKIPLSESLRAHCTDILFQVADLFLPTMHDEVDMVLQILDHADTLLQVLDHALCGLLWNVNTYAHAFDIGCALKLKESVGNVGNRLISWRLHAVRSQKGHLKPSCSPPQPPPTFPGRIVSQRRLLVLLIPEGRAGRGAQVSSDAHHLRPY